MAHHLLWTPTAETFAHHQLAQVMNFWKLGHPAKFHLDVKPGGISDLVLTFQLPSSCEPIPPPSAPPSPQSAVNRSCGLKKANFSRVRRREKRAAERAAAENAAAASVAAENAAAATVKEAEAAAEKAALESAATEIAAESILECNIEKTNVGESGGFEGASTSRITAPSSRSVGKELVLPLCHYCCHKGSGMNPVHYEFMCICDDRDCSCGCYCTEAQLEHRKLHFPGVWSDRYYERRAVMLLDRPKAMAVAEARIVKWNGNRPCWQPSCLQEN